jgi:secondary thiamine-phosphate synthase enzyme
MAVNQAVVTINTTGHGLYAITREINEAVKDFEIKNGLLHLFLQHTSASLLIQENADPTAQQDLQEFLDRLVPENQSWHRHLAEGPDDTVSHLKAAITPSSLTIPITAGKLGLGTWQGLYLWEHRNRHHRRSIVVTAVG